MTHPDAKAEHLATFDVARGLIAQHDGIRHELVQALRLQAEADRAADANLRVVLAGGDTTETQAALDAAVQAFAEFQGGRWLALFWFLTSPLEDLTRDHSNTH